MGRHSRPTPAQQARATTLKAAAALGVAGTIAFGLHSSTGGDRSVQARGDVNTSHEQVPDSDPSADDKPTGSHVSPSASAEPRLVTDGPDGPDGTPGGDRTPGGGTQASDGAGRHAAPHTPAAEDPSKGAPSKAGSPKAPNAPAQRSDQVPAESSAPSQTPGTDPATPSEGPGEQPQAPQQDGKHDKGLVNGVVDGVGDTLDGVIGGIGGVLGG